MELSYSLPLADVLHHIHIAQGLWLIPAEGDGGLLYAVVGGPIGILVVICQVLGCIVAVGTSFSGVAYSNLCLLSQVLATDTIAYPTSLS
jgi:arginine utilization protein RocB